MMSLPLMLVGVRFGWRVLLHFMTPVCFLLFYPLNSIPLTSRCWSWHFLDTQILDETKINCSLKLLTEEAEKQRRTIWKFTVIRYFLWYLFIFWYLHMQRGPTGTVVVVYWQKYSLAATAGVTASAGRAHWWFVYCMSWVVCRTEVTKMTS